MRVIIHFRLLYLILSGLLFLAPLKLHSQKLGLGSTLGISCNRAKGLHYYRNYSRNYHQDYPTLIRKIWVNGKLVFDGNKNDPGNLSPVIEYKDINLRFEFAASFFEAESETMYQCLLEGHDKDWSSWTRETKKDYNYAKLEPGMNTFRVRAKNVYGNLGKEAVFQFKVLPPWYKTWWAFPIFALALLFIMFVIVKWRSWKLVQEKQKIEHIINERTKELKERSEELKEKNLILEHKNVRLEEQSEKLKEMDKVKSRFFVNISHDFRTPLTLIMGLLEQILSNTPNRKELEKKAKMMLRNSQRLLRLINQLLELSKFESGKIKMEASGHNLVSFIKGIAASFEALANQNDMALRFQAEEEAIPLYIDTAKMEEVICNLLINALKFTPAGGEITVTVSKGSSEESNFPTGYVEISVCDTGPGIPREQLANIFDRFYQSDNTYEYQRIGSGIGLEIAKELVELHHGTIAVQSREGDNSGTEFIIRLPMGNAHLKTDEIVDPGVVADVKPGVPADVKAGTPDTDSSEAAGSEKVNDIEPGAHEKDIILVVEDSADVREYIRGALELLYVVVDAKDGKQGIQKAKEIVPDLIISDIMMPEKDGYELCRVLKNDIKTSHIPIILLTVKASEENIIEGLETGADDYITKPFNMKILFARIKNLIDLRTHLQQTINREMTLQPAKMSVSKVDEEFLNDLQTVINKNISDPEFNVEELCKALYIGRTTLYRKIQALSGATPTEFIRSYRLKRGAELLKNKKSCTVLEVALDVGFSDATYFTKCFKKKFHQLPSEFREISKL